MPKRKTERSLVGKDITAPIIKEEPEFAFVEDRTEKLSFKGKMLFSFLFFSLLIVTLTTLGINVMLKIQKFYDTSYFATHPVLEFRQSKEYKSRIYGVKVSSPITIEKKQILTAYIPVTTDGSTVPSTQARVLSQQEKEAVVAKANFPLIVSRIWELETGKGTNTNPTAHHNDCGKIGMSNEFGYRALDNFCFKDFEESVQVVDKYVSEHLNTMTVNQMLCYYNKGEITDACDYAISYHSLGTKDAKIASQ